jgi:hypothetical protein
VQLTRNPDGLARAILRLSRGDASVPGAAWASHLFAVWPRRVGEKDTLGAKVGILGSLHPSPERRLRRLAALGSTVPPPGSARKLPVLAYVLFAPVALLLAGLALTAAGLALMVSLAIDGLFFFGLLVVPLHALLRNLAR